jgi:putative addiction module killer protein
VGEIRETGIYKKWFLNLTDNRAKYRIGVRIERLKIGNPGDVKPAGEGISELRVDYGPGYRVYYKDTRQEIILLLGGDKSTQTADIITAKKLAKEYGNA